MCALVTGVQTCALPIGSPAAHGLLLSGPRQERRRTPATAVCSAVAGPDSCASVRRAPCHAGRNLCAGRRAWARLNVASGARLPSIPALTVPAAAYLMALPALGPTEYGGRFRAPSNAETGGEHA